MVEVVRVVVAVMVEVLVDVAEVIVGRVEAATEGASS